MMSSVVKNKLLVLFYTSVL